MSFDSRNVCAHSLIGIRCKTRGAETRGDGGIYPPNNLTACTTTTNITIIVRKPEKMRVALNQFSYDVMKIRVGKALIKNLCLFRKKTNNLVFLLFCNNGFLKVGLGSNLYNAFLLNINQMESLGSFL